jgi:hypothetical protein
MPDETVIPPAHAALNFGEIAHWLPVITEALQVYPDLQAAKVGETVNTPTVTNARIAHGRYDVVVSFTKRG